MDQAFHGIRFADPASAESNLVLIRQRLPERAWKALPSLLAYVPDPDGALNYLERYLRPDAGAGLASALHYLSRHPAALHYLLVIFSYSRFLSETLIQQPDLITWLHRPAGSRQRFVGIERLKSGEDLEEEFARFEASTVGGSRPPGLDQPDRAPSLILARFKRREYLRITLRDVLGLATLAETTYELSLLADVLLARALRMASQRLEKSYGSPQTLDAAGRLQPAQLVILSLGKLGALELNYSSDVDLMFLYTAEGETSGGTSGSISNAEYFVRLAQSVLKLVTEATPEGAVFRVDLRLRPEGSEGDVALSIPAALDYYRCRARQWELQALIKARPSAGDADAARRFLRELQPLVFQPEFNLAAVEAVLNAREEITRSLARAGARRAELQPQRSPEHAAEFNVKLSPGGVRDIEFLAQCLQRLHGGPDPWLAAPAAASTLVALQRLHDKGHLAQHDFQRLSSAYEFLRRVEHRLQLRDGLQRHTLPDPGTSPPGALDRLARRCGIEPGRGRAPGELLLDRIRTHFLEVREIYDRLLPVQREARPAHPDAEVAEAEHSLLHRLRRDHPRLERAAASLAGPDPFVRRGLLQYLSAALLEPRVLQHLEQQPQLLDRAAELFSLSDLAAEFLSRHAEEISLLHDSSDLPPPAIPESTDDSVAMHALRVHYRRGLFSVLRRSLLGQLRPFDAFARLTCLADWALDASFQISARSTAVRDAPFAVLALGRLGTHEMDIGSDADLVFLADESLTADHRERWRGVAERFVHIVSSHTRDGLLFPVDTRLRPHGTEGDLVQSLAFLREYHRSDAHAWEAATYLKARPVAGNPAFGAEAVGQIHAVLAERWSTPAGTAQLAHQLAELRLRMEKEGTGPRARAEFKHLSGSFYDIEYLVALSFLSAGVVCVLSVSPPATSGHILQQLDALEAVGALRADKATTLRDAATLFRSFDHAHRLVTGRAANRPPDPALAERIVRLLARWQVPLPSPTPEGLRHALASAQRAVRQAYLAAFSVLLSP